MKAYVVMLCPVSQVSGCGSVMVKHIFAISGLN